ncbi:uncharacterized protein BN600_01639 [Roseburia sp. CAG:309]|nr:uncharacterized protein BN600_01639 [Roseburia sp. CAG:309]
MTENTGIFFVSRRIRRNLTKIQIIFGISWLQKDDPVFGIQFFFYGIQRFFCHAVFHTDTGKNTESLWLDIDLAFFAFFRTNLFACGIVSTDEPVAIPAVFLDRSGHIGNFFLCAVSFVVFAKSLAEVSIFFSVFDEHTGDKYRFCHRTIAWTKSLE